MEASEAFFYGLAGGVAAEALGLFKLRREGVPQYARSVFYWVITTIMALIGGGVAVVYIKSGIDLSPFLAVNVGAAAPLIIGELVAQAPDVGPGRVN